MNRRPPPGGLTFGLRGSSTVYGRGGRPGAGRPIVLGIILIGVAILVWFVIGRLCGGSSCDDAYCPSGRDISAPEGYELVSDIYELNAEAPEVANPTDVSGGFSIQFPLSKSLEDGRNLSFYRYVDASSSWEPVTSATLDPQGNIVSGIFRDTPQTVVVMRRLSAAGHVIAYLEHNAAIHPQAFELATIIHTNDLRPNTDGTIAGEITTNLPEGDYLLMPVISASAANRADLATVEQLLAVASARTGHVQAIAKLVSDNHLDGIDIAYMDLTADSRVQFSLFIAELANALHAQGKMLSVTMPSPTKSGDRIDDGGYDWLSVGRDADIVQIAPYRDQSTYRLAMPDILKYLTEGIDPAKIVLTVTPWASEKSSEGVQRLTLASAMANAGKMSIGGGDQQLVTSTNVDIVGINIDESEGLSGITWDKNVACVAYTYKLNGNRTVWIENFFSIGFKLEYISRYKLGGVAIEDASDNIYLGNIWPAIAPFVSSGQPVLYQPNPDDLEPQWRATDGSIAPGPERGTVTWSTPAAPGPQTIYLTVSDGVALFESEIVAVVQQRTSNGATPTRSPG